MLWQRWTPCSPQPGRAAMSEPKRYRCDVEHSDPDGHGAYHQAVMKESNTGRYCAFTDWQAEHAARLAAEERERKASESTHRQARCIQVCARYIGPETSFTVDGLPNAVKALVEERDSLRVQLAAERGRGGKLFEAMLHAECVYRLNVALLDEPSSTLANMQQAIAAYQAQGPES